MSKKFKINNIVFADKGFFINLAASKERYALVLKQIKKYKIKNLFRFQALTDELHQFSCTKSHLKIFEKASRKNLETIFVFEDDFMIEEYCYTPNNTNNYFYDLLKKVHDDLQKTDWDVVLFGCNPRSDMIPVTNNLCLIHKSTGAWAYLINKKAYRFILKNSNYHHDRIAIDDWLPLLNEKGLITLATIPLLINHGVGLISTLQPHLGLINYDVWIKGSYHKHYYDIYD